MAQDLSLRSLQIMGGSGPEFVRAVKVDSLGKLYVLGATHSADFPTRTRLGTGAATNLHPDLFVVKIDPRDWSIVYSTVIGGSGTEHPGALAIDESGNAYVTGETSSPDFPTTPGAYLRELPEAAWTQFTLKLDPAGERLLYSTLLVRCGIPADARAYSLNITVVPARPLSYLAIWPSGVPMPLASTLNSLDGRVVANAAIVPAGVPDGAVNVFVTDRTDVIVDINGYFVP